MSFSSRKCEPFERQLVVAMPLQPADLSFTADGTPFSTRFGDIYHASEGGPGQARHVFLGGNYLPLRWQSRRHFTIAETGFGTGLNFLTSWHAWRNDPHGAQRLHYVACELHPFHCPELKRLHSAWPEFAPLAEQLHEQWPLLVPGMHRLHFEQGRLDLTLFLGEAAIGFAQLRAQVDAFYLDGFAPSKNPTLWSEDIFRQLWRLAAPDATLATWSVAGEIREKLRKNGFVTEKTPGFGGKRHMLRARLAESAVKARHKPAPPTERHALIIGAGMAGSTLANRLGERGWRVDVIESTTAAAQGASGNHVGVLRPLPSVDDNHLARLTRAGSLYAKRHLQALTAQGQKPLWDACGVLHLARDALHEERQRQTVQQHQYPSAYLRFVDREEASALASWPVPYGAWWFPQGGWVQPPSLCTANLTNPAHAIACHFGRVMQQLRYQAGVWSAFDPLGHCIAQAPIAILANGTGILNVAQATALPVRSARGQVSYFPAEGAQAPKVVICRLGYISPTVASLCCTGASFSVNDNETALRESDHQENLAKLNFILPGYTASLPPAIHTTAAGRVGFRPISPDRLPIIGQIPLDTSACPAGTPLSRIPRHPGLYALSGFGARGLVWASLLAECLASQLEGEPIPLEQELLDATDPARFLLRRNNRKPQPSRHAKNAAEQQTPCKLLQIDSK